MLPRQLLLLLVKLAAAMRRVASEDNGGGLVRIVLLNSALVDLAVGTSTLPIMIEAVRVCEERCAAAAARAVEVGETE